MTANSYTRQSAASIVTSNVIQASDFNNEYNQLQSAFDSAAGHDHSGGTGLSQKIPLTTSVVGVLPTANGGTGIAYFTAAGPSVARVYTFPDAACSILTTNAVVTASQGGTGVANSSTITLGGNFTTSGAACTLTLTGSTNVTLPTSGTLCTTVGSSSIVTVGTVGTGTWNASVIGPAYGGTGVGNNASNTITFSGNFGLTLTLSNTTSVTLPTSGTLVNSSVSALSSLATVGTITSGVWNGTIVTGTYGGTGINNGSNTITLGGNLTTSGAFGITLTATALTSVTLPTSGTLLSTAAAVTVAQGGTSATSFTAYSVICGGTTSTGALQNVSGVGTSGNVLVSQGASALPQWKGTNTYSASPGDPAATSSTTAVMMGLGGTITPATTGTIMIIVSGSGSNATSNAGVGIGIRYGTGVAPVNGAALTGTASGTAQNTLNVTATAQTGFCCSGIVTGLSVGTAYWIDLSLKTISAGTATIAGITISAYEVK